MLYFFSWFVLLKLGCVLYTHASCMLSNRVIISFLSTNDLHLLFYYQFRNLTLFEIVLMTLFCATMNRDSVSLFYENIGYLPWATSTRKRLKSPFIRKCQMDLGAKVLVLRQLTRSTLYVSRLIIYSFNLSNSPAWSPVGWGSRIQRLHLSPSNVLIWH